MARTISPKKLLEALRDKAGFVEETIIFYNIRVARRDDVVNREFSALMDKYEPFFVGYCEGVGYSLKDQRGYLPIRNTANRSRANVGAYVRENIPLSATWEDMKTTWPRTEHEGTHEPRSLLKIRPGRIRGAVAHQPPLNAKTALIGQQEQIVALSEWLKPKDGGGNAILKRLQPAFVIWDANRKPGLHGPGPTKLARMIKGKIAGKHIDCMVYRNMKVLKVEYVKSFMLDGTKIVLGTDHPWGAMVIRVRFHKAWLYGFGRKKNK